MQVGAVIQRESAVDQCTRLLREAIVEGDLEVGERLLPERELARRLGVNRVTVRTALDRLASLRLLQVRQGSGYEVQDFRRTGGLGLIPTLLGVRPKKKRVRAIARDLLLLRRLLLRGALERIAEETPEDLVVVLRRGIEALALEEDVGRQRDLDRIVIDTIMEASGSHVLSLAMNPCLAVLDQVPSLVEAEAQVPRGRLPVWRKLLRGLEKRKKTLSADVLAELGRRDEQLLGSL